MANRKVEIDLNTPEVKTQLYRALNNVIADAQWALRNSHVSGAFSSEGDIQAAITVLQALKS